MMSKLREREQQVWERRGLLIALFACYTGLNCSKG
jgi:hypothetical protein